MRTALLIAAKDLRQRLRDRSVLLFAVVAPLGLALIFSQLLAGVSAFHASYVVADLDGGTDAVVFRGQVLQGLVDARVATIEEVATAAAAAAAVEDGRADAAFVIPTGFTTAITAGQPTSIAVPGATDAGLATDIARSVAAGFGDAVARAQLGVLTVGDLRGSRPPADEVSRIAALVTQPAISLVKSTAPLRQLSWSTYFCAGMAVLFLFFATQAGMLSLFEERRQGTLARMLAGPVHPASILLGKAIASLVTGLVAMTVLVVATTLLIGAEWGPPPGVAMIVLAAVISAIGLTALVTSFMHTLDGARSANSAVAITLGILGGTFAPVSQGPEALSTLSLLTPHAWFLRGLGDLHGTGATIADALPAVGVLLAMGLVTGAIGFARARRLVAPR